MSEIRVNTLKVRSGAEQQGTKAYLSLKQDDQTTHKSLNISGTTDDGAGTNTYSYTNNMADAEYLSVGASHNTGEYWGVDPYPGDPDAASHQTGSSVLQVAHINSGTGLPAVADLNIVNIVVFGDVA